MARNDDEHDPDAPAPWHNSTAKVLGASVAAVAGIGLIVGSVIFVTQQVGEPTQAPLNFVDPSFSATSAPSTSSAPSTTSASRPTQAQTTDIDLPPPSETPPPPPTSAEPPSTRPPTTRENDEDDDEDGPTTTRNRPRFNETRTLYPRP
ncbi:hypothetical protein JRC04_27995 [Mycolicibacterium sp. S2-37]|uniref:hypothetical protein n=1 Tax=Mycolicibacterium sp. S2-37 TaxID=2810297 RepID=UPI001A946BCC|nr:hypothetical protein [Mycolicibacterium sp. S2-37]MBO0681322.1 hypothetical protein [Mycolicibacterium sp. S2-37]